MLDGASLLMQMQMHDHHLLMQMQMHGYWNDRHAHGCHDHYYYDGWMIHGVHHLNGFLHCARYRCCRYDGLPLSLHAADDGCRYRCGWFAVRRSFAMMVCHHHHRLCLHVHYLYFRDLEQG